MLSQQILKVQTSYIHLQKRLNGEKGFHNVIVIAT